MELKKIDTTYDTYTAKLSFLELRTLADALTIGGRGPIADELRRSIEWHFERIPKPGQTADELKAEDEAVEEIEKAGDDGQGPEVETPAEPSEVDTAADELLPSAPAGGGEK